MVSGVLLVLKFRRVGVSGLVRWIKFFWLIVMLSGFGWFWGGGLGVVMDDYWE